MNSFVPWPMGFFVLWQLKTFLLYRNERRQAQLRVNCAAKETEDPSPDEPAPGALPADGPRRRAGARIPPATSRSRSPGKYSPDSRSRRPCSTESRAEGRWGGPRVRSLPQLSNPGPVPLKAAGSGGRATCEPDANVTGHAYHPGLAGSSPRTALTSGHWIEPSANGQARRRKAVSDGGAQYV